MIKSKNSKDYKGASIRFAVSFLLLLNVLSLSCFGQGSTKKKVFEEDYAKWGTLHTVAVAEHSDWVSFRMVYDNGIDTLFVKNVTSGKEFRIPNGTNGRFTGSGRFIYRLPSHGYGIISLSDSGRITLSDAQWLEVSRNRKHLVTSSAAPGKLAAITVRDYKGKALLTLTDVMEYGISPDNKGLTYTSKKDGYYYVGILDLDKLSAIAIASGNYPYSALAWQKNGRSVAFINDRNGDTIATSKLCFYDRNKGCLKEWNIGQNPGATEGRINVQSGLQVSNDGEKVFFSVERKTAKDTAGSISADSPEIWYSNTPLIYPTAKSIAGFESNLQRHVWYPYLGFVNNISTEGTWDAKLTGRENYAIVSSNGKYPANYKFYPDTDYHITSVKDESSSVFLEKQSSDPSMISLSPVSDYIAYYKEQNWHLYDPAKQIHQNLTSGINTKWDTTEENHIPPVIPYGVAGWSADSKSILLYDKFDIWMVDLHTGKKHRMTGGRERNTVFRLELSATGKALNLNNGLLLAANDKANASRGYYLWRRDKSLVSLSAEKTWNDQITGLPNGNLIFREQSFESSPRLVFISANTNKRQIVHSSNTHQKHYDWGTSELVHYKDKKGHDLKGALLYPAGYVERKKYPMVVFIYESMSQRLRQYKNPSMHNEDGFNVTNYTLDGYFVLLPDIYYEIGSPGKSATDCITAAVSAALVKTGIDEAKIGLIGHSFGGYEANITISQTGIFAAAVSGAGAGDTTGWYFSIGQDIGEAEAWRFENQQYRMGKSFFEDRQAYIDNSPIMNAATIHTPVLLWSGKEDSTVPVSQSIAMHIALKRLNKDNIFLAYPKESHVIMDKLMQEDLTKRIRDWFGYFLKDRPVPDWISQGFK